ncbi:hypothetical protein GCM10010211_49290 [Streptomyces albospinus]|uniref:Uncharacterized protein n=1 Tax=Streptomyces albospinus TaxID=285515 RepID=A0ABQ2VB80_9ACTN|nr:hypothetical protein GCM10010211_49290 [Streptomyces albospinus]
MPISSPGNPTGPCWIGSAPTVNAIGSATGAAIRSYGRTHAPAHTLTSRKNTPYAVCAPWNSNWSRYANDSSARAASSPQPSPVSLAAGIRSSRPATGAGAGRCGRAR